MGSRKTLAVIIVMAVVAIIGAALVVGQKSGPGKLDRFVKCLKDKKALFYGAFWCSHCQNQKKLFGSSSEHLPYIECSTADGRQQLDVCKKKNITGYPTWEFNDGSRVSGEMTLEKLAEKTNCQLQE